MAIVNYKPLTQNPNYLMLPQRPQGIDPNKTGGKIAHGIADVLEQGIHSADEIQKQFLENQAREVFTKANESEKLDLQEKIRQGDRVLGNNADGSEGGSGYYTGDFGGSPSAIPQPKAMNMDVEGAGGAEGQLPTGSAPVQYTDDTAPGYPKLEDQPTPIQNVLKRQIDIRQAYDQGKFHDTARQTEGEAAMSSLKAQFPGRTKEIDALAAHYGITQNKQISDLRSVANDQQTQIRQKQSADDKFEQENARYLVGDPANGKPGIDPRYFERDKAWRNSPEVRNRLNREIGAIKGHEDNIKLQQSELSLSNAQRDQKKPVAEAITGNNAQLQAGIWVTSIMRDMGYTSVSGDNIGNAVKEFTTQLQNEKDPKKLEYAQTQLNGFATAFVQDQLRQAGKEVADKKTGETNLSLLGPQKVQELAKLYASPFTELANAITNKESGMLGTSARIATAVTDADKLAIVNDPNHRTAEGWAYLKEKYPPEVVTQMIQDRRGKPGDAYTAGNLLIDSTLIGVGNNKKLPSTGDTPKFSDYVRDYATKVKENGIAGAMPPARDVNTILERTYQNIMNPKLPQEAQKDFANFIFGDDRALRLMKDEDQMTFLQRYAQPPVGDKIYSFGDQNLINGYKKMVTEAATGAARSITADIADMNGVRKTLSAPELNVRYNPDKNRIEANLPPPPEQPGFMQSMKDLFVARKGGTDFPPAMQGGKDPFTNMMAQATLGEARRLVDNYNSILSSMEPIFKRDGAAAVPPALIQSIMGSGIKVETNSEGKGDKTPTARPVDAEAVKTLVNPQAQGLTPPGAYPAVTNGPQGRFEELQQMPAKRSDAELPAQSQLASYAPQAPQAQGEAQAAITQAISAPKGANNVQKIMVDRLQQEGLKDYQIAAVMGHAEQESGFKPSASNTKGENSYGLFQWNQDRHAAMEQFLKDNGYKKNDPKGQMEFFMHEMKGPERAAWRALLNSQNVEQANMAMKQFERYGDNSTSTRLSNARRFLASLSR
jgi:hypothetical protein